MTDECEVFKVITANRLREGDIVYLSGDGDPLAWSPNLDDALVIAEPDVEALLHRAEQDARVISVYAAEIAGRRTPISARERIRAIGPSIKFGRDALAPDTPDFSI